MDFSRALVMKLFALTLTLLVLPSFAISWYALNAFERELLPEIDKKSAVVGRSIATQMGRAVEYGISMNRMVGVNDFLREILEDNRNINYVAVADADGRIVYSLGLRPTMRPELERAPADAGEPPAEGMTRLIGAYYDTTASIMAGGARVGAVHVGVEQSFVQKQLQEILYDILTALVVSLLVTFELLLFLVALNVSNPIRLIQHLVRSAEQGDFSQYAAARSGDEIGRLASAFNETVRRINTHYERLLVQVAEIKAEHYDRRVAREVEAVLQGLRGRLTLSGGSGARRIFPSSVLDVRTPLFIFVFAEEMSRSFFPVFVRDLYAPIPWLTEAAAIGLPIAVFMAFVAIATPWSGSLVDRIGPRRVFLIGLVPAGIGFVLTGMASDIHDLILWRSLTAIGYAMSTIACQGYIVELTQADQRARSMSVFVGAVIAAGICGNAIGGIMADRIGFRATFYFSAGLTVVSGILVYYFLTGAAEQGRSAARRLRLSDFAVMMRNGRFMALLLLSAIPAKIILTAFLFYLVPLYLNELGATKSETGRIMMAYGVCLVAVAPVAAYLSDRYGARASFIGFGGLVSGLGALAVWWWADAWMVLAGVAALGLGHAASTSTQLAILPEICAREIREIGQTTVFSMLRLLERAGSVMGPFVAAWFVERQGYAAAIVGTGLMTLVAAALFCLFFLLAGTGRNAAAEGAPS